jgi:diguanylate cyclase (GGDEF)-like protein
MEILSSVHGAATIVRADMWLARPASGQTRRPKLLALVFGVVLVLVGVTASALVAIASSHLSSTTLTGVVSRDASLVELFINGNLRASDVDANGPSALRVRELSGLLDTLTRDDGILLIELRALDGTVLASSSRGAIGAVGDPSSAMAAAVDGKPTATVVEGSSATAAVQIANVESVVEEFLPVVDGEKRTLAVVAMWRDAAAVIAGLDDTRRDVMLVTLAAAVLLAALLYLIFRTAQARLARQHDQLIESTRRDALTELLNHGEVVSLLTDEIEAARENGLHIGIALVDVDNFRLFNDTHGHDAADDVLLRVAHLVAREEAAGHVARYGPDEFLIVRTDGGVAEMTEAVERLRHGLTEVSVQFGDSEALPVSVSAGICAYPEHGASVTDLLSAAAVAVAEAKGSGGDAVRIAHVGEEERVVVGRLDVLQGLVIAIDTKDRYTKRHSEDVARYAAFLAERVGLDEETQRTIHLAGLLHDVGKIGIPDVILRKPSKLTADEYGMFQQHVALGDAIVRDVPNVELVRAGIRHHHERWDGKGYLEGLEGETIPLIARVLAVADAFSAMTTTRPYRRALPITEALKRLGDAAGAQLEESLVSAFISGIETAPDAPLPGDEPTSIWRPELWVA